MGTVSGTDGIHGLGLPAVRLDKQSDLATSL